MSWLTVFARSVGLGPLLDTIEGAEANPTPETIVAAAGAVAQAAPAAANTAIADLGNMASQVIVGAAAKVNPSAGTFAAEKVGPFLAEVEQVAEKWLAAATGGIV